MPVGNFQHSIDDVRLHNVAIQFALQPVSKWQVHYFQLDDVIVSKCILE